MGISVKTLDTRNDDERKSFNQILSCLAQTHTHTHRCQYYQSFPLLFHGAQQLGELLQGLSWKKVTVQISNMLVFLFLSLLDWVLLLRTQPWIVSKNLILDWQYRQCDNFSKGTAAKKNPVGPKFIFPHRPQYKNKGVFLLKDDRKRAQHFISRL